VSFTISGVSLTLDVGTADQDPYINTVTVTATDDEGTAAIDDDTATIIVDNATPTITIVKEVDANKDGTFADSETVAEGTRTVDYKFTVTAGANASTDVLTVNSFADAKLNAAGVSNTALLDAFKVANGGSATLAPNTSVSFTISGVSLTLDVGTADQDPYINTVTVTATDDEGTAAIDEDTATIIVDNATPTITIVKTVDANKDKIFNDVENLTNVDGKADYRYVVTNASPAGAVDPLTLTSFVDDRGTISTSDDVNLLSGFVFGSSYGDYYASGDTDNDYRVDSSESWTFEANLLVPFSAASKTNKNIATVSGEDDEGSPTSATDDAMVKFIDYGQIAPTNTTCVEYINSTAQDFSQFYASQGGVIQYNVNNQGKIGSTNPGVFFYYTGLSGSIKGFDGLDAGTAPDSITVKIDQSDPSDLFPAFMATKNDVKLFKVNDLDGNGIDPGDTCSQVQLGSSQITLGSGASAGDVTVKFTPDAVGSLYVISVQYKTGSVVGTPVPVGTNPAILPTVNYTFNTDVGDDGSIDETSVGGITIAPKFDALKLNSAPATGGATLVQDQADPVIGAAINYWAAQGISDANLDKLRRTDVLIGDLGGTLLGGSDGFKVLIDDDAAGHGWSVSLDGVQARQVDLFSTVVHEFGHILGYEHDVMGEALGVGERRLPFAPLSTETYQMPSLLAI
jgi:hypothetical protein